MEANKGDKPDPPRGGRKLLEEWHVRRKKWWIRCKNGPTRKFTIGWMVRQHTDYQDVGHRRNFQTTLGCYAFEISNRSFHSIHNRLKGIYYLPHGYSGGNCVSAQRI